MDKEFLDFYSDYLISSFSQVTATGLSGLLGGYLSHDQITSRLRKKPLSSQELWQIVKPIIRKFEEEEGVLIFDDTIEYKPHTDENEIVGWYYDHTVNRTVKGINILNCVYHTGEITLPVAFTIVKKTQEVINKKTGKIKRVAEETKNQLMREMLKTCQQNRLQFRYVLTDIWFSSKENMSTIKENIKKNFIMALKGNRLVALSMEDKLAGNFVNVESVELNPDTCCEVFISGLSFPVQLTKQVFTNKDGSIGILYLVCSDLTLQTSDILTIYQKRWKVEEMHKSLKSNLALAKSPTGIVNTQSNHIFACFYAFVKFELLRIKTDLNHFAIKSRLYFNAIKASFAELQRISSPST